jgi:hypothetical protein
MKIPRLHLPTTVPTPNVALQTMVLTAPEMVMTTIPETAILISDPTATPAAVAVGAC